MNETVARYGEKLLALLLSTIFASALLWTTIALLNLAID